jgi:hypothetical protein
MISSLFHFLKKNRFRLYSLGIFLPSILFFSFFLFKFFHTNTSIQGKVLICGVCKDIEKIIPYSIKNAETIGALFDDYKVFIYENNSQDQTAKLLKEWEKNNPNVFITTEIVNDEILSFSCFNKTIQNEFYRPEKIARARNIVLDQVMDSAYDDFEYVIWLDLDFDHLLPYKEIVKTFHSKKNWDAVFANGIADNGNLFDSWALRDEILPIGAELIGNQWWMIRGCQSILHFSPKDPWYRVFSAFGGLGIYKREAIKGCKYSAIVTSDLEKLSKKLISERTGKNHREIDLYFKEISSLRSIIQLQSPTKNLPYYKDQLGDFVNGHDGFILENSEDKLIFRMNSGVCQYPCVCEHIPFHASMILHGYDKLYINPALVLHYFNRK